MDSDPDDYWAQAVTSYTGYPMPKRTSLFDKLKSKEGIPLMRVNLVQHDMRAVRPEDYTAVSGWQASHGEDYRLAFYTHHGGQGVKLYTADIVFIGTLADADGKSHLSDAGSTREGGAFKGKYGDEWDDTDLWRYVSAPKFALEKLVNEPYSTKNFSYNGVDVPDAGAVDLVSFTRTAQAFDRAAAFFRRQLKPLEEWNKSLGGDDAAWKGQSADVVRTLIQTLHKNYESYAEQMGGREFTSPHQLLGNGYPAPESTYAEALFQAQWDLLWEARMMKEAWQRWADSAEHDPHRALLEQLDALSDWIIHNNVPLVTVDPGSLGSQYGWSSDDDGDEDLRYTSETSFDTLPGFSDSPPDMGALDDLNSWKALGENAVKRWNDNVNGYLVAAAKQSLSNLGKSWGDASEDVGREVQPKETDNLSGAYQKKETKSEKEASQKALDDANKKNSQAWDNLNKNLSDSNHNNKSLFDNLNQNLTDSNNNQKQLNDGLNGLGNSLGNGLSGLGDNLSRSLNPEGPGGGLNLSGGGETSLLNGGLNTPADGPGGVDGPLGNGTTLPFGNLSSLNPNTTRGDSSPVDLNPGSLTDGPHLDADGNLVRTFPDGTRTVFDPDTGQLVTTAPDGHTTTSRLNPGDVVTNPDGSHTRLNADGTLTTESPDGTRTVFDPSDGTLHTTKPDGHTTTTHLNKPIDIPDLSSGGSNLPHGGTSALNDTHLDTHLGTRLGTGDGRLHDDADADYLDYDSTPFTGGRLGGGVGGFDLASAGNHNSAPSAGGTPLNPGLGGGAGAGGAGTGGANGERVRTALNDTSNLSALRRNGAAAPAIDGEAMPFRRGGTQTTSSPMGGAPMGGTQGGQSTESAERQRTNWVEEDEDVWGTEDGGAPAVIG
ncbi:AAWKG family protein [Streptomyces spinosus]|uniref:AAWKG family protein n=1 Tax=Streptomyces spinosus TaxID=2872623 RepID=UPI001CED3C4E|nr:AAWKG family protein [Streptomyces spinosus]